MPVAAHVLVLVVIDCSEDVINRRAHILNLVTF
jgi:hypothetical protein